MNQRQYYASEHERRKFKRTGGALLRLSDEANPTPDPTSGQSDSTLQFLRKKKALTRVKSLTSA